MASTPAVGPSPTTRTKTSAHTSSGTLRSTISNQRSSCRSQNGPRAMRPDSAETDSTRVETSASGTASTSANVKPAVAMATVRQASRATIARNSAECAGGRKLARNWPVTARLRGSNSPAGRNSVATSSGHSSTAAAASQPSRPSQAGSRLGAGCGVASLTGAVAQAFIGGAGRLNGSASPPAPGWPAQAADRARLPRRPARPRAGRKAAPAGHA